MQTNSSKTKLVLIELIIIILFFSLASAVCVNIFVQARMLSVNSTDTTKASLAAQSAVEVLRESDGDLSRLENHFSKNEDQYIVYYDEDWIEIDDGHAKYNLVIDLSDTTEDLLVADVSVYKDLEEIYSVSTKKYVGK